jgi:ABC-2 type transport system ATP-binding protein
MYDTEVRRTDQPTDVRSGVRARGLGKRYGDTWALRDLDLDVPAGHVLGLLGHNGAGKTTALRILTTLSRPTAGRATVAGLDVVERPAAVRDVIGVAGQEACVDGLLTGRANLEMVGRLCHLGRAGARGRADELLATFDLTDAGDDLVRTYSGGMRRRLDLAAALVARPRVLFLDEPTTGLDPRSRGDLWQVLRDLVAGGTTLVLTTQYLEEADRLADAIVVLDHGAVAARGTPSELKALVGGDRMEISLAAGADVAAALAAVGPFAAQAPSFDADSRLVTAPVEAATRFVDVVRALDAAAVDVVDVGRREATLDDVFLTITAPREVPA